MLLSSNNRVQELLEKALECVAVITIILERKLKLSWFSSYVTIKLENPKKQWIASSNIKNDTSN